jgi:gamma-glutamyl-gamma-aminobutyrate hydrolase PuuD
MTSLKIIMSNVLVGKFGSYIPVILRAVGNHEVESIIHSIPSENINNVDGLSRILIEDARRRAENADLIIIPGGADVNPKFYGQLPNVNTDVTDPLSFRDQVEEVMINTAFERDIPILFICRGFQIGLLMMSRGVDPSMLQFCQHLPDVTTGKHMNEQFHKWKELTFNSHYAAGELANDIIHQHASAIIHEPDMLHRIRIFPNTITHALYSHALSLDSGFNEPIEINEVSHHHQGFVINKGLQMPSPLVCSAISLAADEVTIAEGFEDPTKSFCVATQWHFEANATGRLYRLFKMITDYAEFRRDNPTVKFLEWRASL